jgi:hypothetical protein
MGDFSQSHDYRYIFLLCYLMQRDYALIILSIYTRLICSSIFYNLFFRTLTLQEVTVEDMHSFQQMSATDYLIVLSQEKSFKPLQDKFQQLGSHPAGPLE